ncbi:MAG: hypothetical protein JO222_06940 [Frankiales bacterium]|nr:hypothetical protein [Frankiales bacterium]
MGQVAVRRRAAGAGKSTVAALSLALLAGCGTTVSGASALRATGSDSGLNGGTPTSDGLGGPSTTGGSGAGATGGGGSGQTVAGGGTTSGSSTASGGGGATTPGAPSGSTGVPQLPSSNGRVTLRLGVVYLKGLDQAYKAANGGKSSATDSKADYAAVIHALNTAPGNRVTLVPSYYAIDASSTQSQADQQQAACASFTSDVKTDIVVSYTAGASGSLAQCLAKHGIPLIDAAAGASVGASVQRAVPTMWQPSQLSLDRVGGLEASYLVRNHWVDQRWGTAARCATVKQPRIGVVTFDRPDWRAAYSRVVAPTFRAAGQPVYDVEFLAVSGSTAQQLAQASSGAQNAVLKFSSDCVDHVAFIGNVALDYLFMDVAQQQNYNPRYGLSSLEDPPVIVQNLTQPAAQLRGSIGPGWSPFSDVAAAQLDSMAKRPAATCLSILQHAGLTPTDNNSTFLALPSCEGPMFAQFVVRTWLAAGQHGTLLDVVNGLHSAYVPVGTYSADLSAAHHDGAAAYRGFAFTDSCSCFRYTSGLRSIP